MNDAIRGYLCLCLLSGSALEYAHAATHRAVNLSSGNARAMSTDAHSFGHAVNNGAENGDFQEGDLTCMKWTGGLCRIDPCNSARRAECIAGRCMCPSGTCAAASGKCEAGTGSWIGSYAIQFLKPLDGKPYLGVSSTRTMGPYYVAMGTTTNSQQQWKIAMTPSGLVRFESIELPGYVMSRPAVVSSEDPALADPEHEPEQSVTRVSLARPIDVTFQLHEVPGGLEIYYPGSKAFGMSNTGYAFRATNRGRGVAACEPNGSFLAKSCEGHELVTLEPSLPSKAIHQGKRAVVDAVSPLGWSHLILLLPFVCMATCMVGCCIAAGSS